MSVCILAVLFGEVLCMSVDLKYLPAEFDLDLFLWELRNWLNSYGVQNVVIGISGGKDSTIAAKLMVEVLGEDHVMGVLMPNGHQSDLADAYRVVDLLGIPHMEVSIGAVDSAIKRVLRGSQQVVLTPDADINLGPRIRMTVLYAVAQSLPGSWRVCGTTNKSESTIGWLTKWGDGAADIEPLATLTVCELRELGMLLGLPEDLVYKVPADGLAAGSDEDRFGFTYEQLDAWIRYGTSGGFIADQKIREMSVRSEHKRVEVPCFHSSLVPCKF